MGVGRYAAGSRKGIGGRPRGAPTAVVRIPVPVARIARHIAAGTLRAGDINAFLDISPRSQVAVPLVGATAPCGFPSPADDWLERALDFNELLVHNPASTFAVRLSSDSMTGAGLFPGDIAIVDRSVEPTNGCIVVALLDGEFTVKRYQRRAKGVLLRAENPAYKDMEVSEERAFEVWGVVTKSIRML
jgi:DNA polymerase V